MTNLRTVVTTTAVAAGLLLTSSVYADGIVLPSVSRAEFPLGPDSRTGIAGATTDYLLLHDGPAGDGQIWSIQDSAVVNTPAGASIAAITRDANGNHIAAGTFGGQAYQWTLNGTSATQTPLGAAYLPSVNGASGSIVVGVTDQEGNGGASAHATYWRGGSAYALPTPGLSSSAYAVHGNTAVGVSVDQDYKWNATAWRIPADNSTATAIKLSNTEYDSEAYAVSGNLIGGYVTDSDYNTQATVWRLNHTTNQASELILHPTELNGEPTFFSTVTAVESQVQIGDSFFDIAVGNVAVNVFSQTAALWILPTGVFGEDSPFSMIELMDPEGVDVKQSFATSIVMDNGQMLIYGYGYIDDVQGQTDYMVPLMWHMDGVGAQVPEAMTASLLLAGTCGLFLRRPRRS